MNGSARILLVVVVGFGFAGSALAAMDSAAGGQTATPDAQAPARINQKLRDDLTKAGFTDIAIMPSSFIVRARDSQGNPVMMIINADSLAEATQRTTEHHDAPLSGAIKGAPNSPIPSPPPKP